MIINWYVVGEDTHDELPQHWHRTRTNFNQPAKIWTILLKYSLVYNIGQGSYSTKQPATGHGEWWSTYQLRQKKNFVPLYIDRMTFEVI